MTRELPGPGDFLTALELSDDRYDDAFDAWRADPQGAAVDFIDYLNDNDLGDPDTITDFDEWLDSADAEIAFDRHFDTLGEP